MVLRFLMRHWLGGLARRKVQETVVSAARGSAASAAEAEQAQGEPQRRKCDVGVVFALGIEAGGLEDLLSDIVTFRGPGLVVRRGLLDSRPVAVARAGPGAAAAERATEALIAGHQPDWIISAGFAGGLVEGLQRNDLVMGNAVTRAGGERLSLDLRVDPAALAATPGVHIGGLVTAERIIRLPEEKSELGRQYQSLAVDMETFAVAEVCRREKVRLLAVRVISDTVGDRLPEDLDRLMRQGKPTRKLGAVVGTVMNRPGSVKDMLKLKENALVGSDRLAAFLASMIRQLAPVLPPP